MASSSDGYGKIFRSIWSSTLMELPVETRLIFIFLTTSCGADGIYIGGAGAIARATNIPLLKVTAALAELQSSDPLSRTPDDGGRRITDVSDGKNGAEWMVVNYRKYRDKGSRAERADYHARYYTEKTLPKRASTRVNKRQHVSTDSIQGDGDGDGSKRGGRKGKPSSLAEVESFWKEKGLHGSAEEFYYYREDKGWGRDWQAAARKWSLLEVKYGVKSKGQRTLDAPSMDDWERARSAAV